MFRLYLQIGLISAALGLLWFGAALPWVSALLLLALALLLIQWQPGQARNQPTQEQLAASVFDTSSNGIMITNPHNQVLAVNAAFTNITGYSAEDIVGQNPHILSSGRHDHTFYEQLWRSVQEQGMWQGEIWNRKKNGAVFAEWLTISVAKNTQGETSHHIAIFSDITDRQAQAERLEFMATHDPLTSLPNRSLFTELLSNVLAEARRSKKSVAVLFLDIDKFKQINDTLGHDVGDLLLLHVAKQLRLLLRDGDLVARQGGDEFIMALPNLTSSSVASLLAEKILRALEQPCTLPNTPQGHTMKVSASIGIALYPENGTDIESLLKCADIALYRAKQAGRNNYQLFNQDPSGAASSASA